MYAPEYTIVTDRTLINEVIDQFPFATIVFDKEAIHLPLIQKDGVLVGHMARKNPAWKSINGHEALAIFHGPQGYISPVWYESEEKLPTWNYVTVHVRGNVEIFEDEVSTEKALLLLGKHEDESYDLASAIAENRKLLKEIVAFTISIGSIEAKFKLAQQKSKQEMLHVVDHLRNLPMKNQLADYMEQFAQKK